MGFTLRQLEYFIATGEECSIRRAAENMNVSQPSVSTAISQLERHYQVQLFVRHHAQGLSLTTAGKGFLKEAKLFRVHAGELEQTLVELNSSVAGRLEIAVFSSLAPFVVPGLCHQFSAIHSAVDLNVTETDQAEILRLIRHGDVDLAITYDLDLPDELDFQPLAKLPPYAVIASDHELSVRKQISLDTLAKWPLVLLDLPLSQEYFLSLFRLSGLKPNILTTTGQMEVMRGLVGQGFGYGLANVKPRNRASLEGKALSYVPLSGSCPPLTMGILTLNRKYASKVTESFLGHSRNLLREGFFT